jgi:hypothetical protein
MKEPFVLSHQEKLSLIKRNVMNNISKTDWSRIDAMTDDDIDTSDSPLRCTQAIRPKDQKIREREELPGKRSSTKYHLVNV